MKRLTVILFISVVMVTLISASASAQGITGKGVKIGLNGAKLAGDFGDVLNDGLVSLGFTNVSVDEKRRIGFSAGAFFTYSINEMFAVQPEILFTMKGSKYDTEATLSGITVKTTATEKLNYLEIPVLAKVVIPVEGKFSPNLFAGPYFAIKLSAKVKAEATVSGITVEAEADDDDVRSFDYGMVFGGGVDYSLATGKVTFDVRYSLGLRDIYDTSGTDFSVKNSVISAMIGYSF